MSESDRTREVVVLLREYVSSPSLSHIRDHEMLWRLAANVVKVVDGSNTVWQKWTGLRESLLKPAIFCWIPVEDLVENLNKLPGPALTKTDVAQRIRAYQDEDYYNYPNEDFKSGCLELYEAEKSSGTELIAIIRAINDYIEAKDDMARRRQYEENRRRIQEEKAAVELRLRSGADCKWATIGKSPDLYCRKNGRTFKLHQTADKLWVATRVKSIEDQNGDIIGKYRLRGDATKVITQMAYALE